MGIKKELINCCYKCGVELTEKNGLYNRPYCIDCQQEFYETLEQEHGIHLSLYFMALKIDLPLYPLLLPDNFNEEENKWISYIDLLDKNDKLFKEDGELATFFDGESNMLRIFGKDFTERDFSKFVRFEKEKIAKQQGTPHQREIWGTTDLWQGLHLTTKLYNELDKRYMQRVGRYKGITVDDQMEETLRRVCKLTVAQDFLQSNGDASGVDKLQKTINSIMEAEQLRKKDEKPQEVFTAGGLLEALENAGLVEDGAFKDLDSVQEALFKFATRKGKYDYSIDVVDQVINDIYKTMRTNADLFIESELPDSLKVNDIYGEFLEEETEQEKQVKKYAGLTKVAFTDKGEGNNA